MPDDTTPAQPAKLSRKQVADLVGEEIPGLSKAGVEGVVRNVFRESGGDPKIIGDQGTSGGLFQHHNSRLDGLKAFAKAQGSDWQDPRTQVRFSASELKKDYPTLLAQLQRADDPAEAEDSFKRVFERPASIMWANNPRTASEGHSYSPYALNEHKGRKGTDLVYMAPGDFLDLAPDMEEAPWSTPSGKSLRNSVGRGDQIEAIPTLDMKVNGGTGQVTDQDGRHRALLAQEEGIDSIPVAIRQKGNGDPKEVQGLSGNVLPYDFPKAKDAPKDASVWKRALDAIIPSAEAAEPKQAQGWGEHDELVPEQPKQQNQQNQQPQQAQGWGANDEVKQPDGMLTSAAKGVGAGFGKAVLGGQELVGKGLEAASDFVSPPQQGIAGVTSAEASGQQPQGRRAMVGRWGEWLVDDARKGVKDLDQETEADRQAHPWATGGGEVAGNLAAQLLLTKGRGGFGRSNTMQALTGGGLAGALQPVGQDDGYWLRKALDTGEGAALGGVTNAAAARIAKWIEPQIRPIREFVERVSGQPLARNPAAAAIVKRMERDAKSGGPTAQDMIDLANKTPNKPVTLADLGGPEIQALTGRVARKPGEARSKMTNFLNQRDAEAGERLGEDINQGIGRDSSYQLSKAMKSSRAAAARPLYDAAYAHPAINPDELVPHGQAQRAGSIGAMLDRPSFRAGMKNAHKIAAEEGVNLTADGVDLDAQGVPFFTKVPTWRALDYIKRGMDDVVEAYRDKTTGRLVLDTYGRAADQTRAGFRETLKKLNPEYAKALNAYSGASTSLDALHAGEDFLKRSPEEITDRVRSYGTGDREFYRLGAANTLRERLEKRAASADEAKAIINSEYMRKQLRPLFEHEADFHKFVDAVTAEGQMFRTRFNALGGSQTAGRLAEDGSPAIDAMSHAARGLWQGMHGNLLGAAANAIRAGKAALATRDPRTNSAMADILTMPLAQGSTAQRLHDFKTFLSALPVTRAHMAKNALAGLTRGAGPLAGIGAADATLRRQNGQ